MHLLHWVLFVVLDVGAHHTLTMLCYLFRENGQPINDYIRSRTGKIVPMHAAINLHNVSVSEIINIHSTVGGSRRFKVIAADSHTALLCELS